MAAVLSAISRQRLMTCDKRLIRIVEALLEDGVSVHVLCGHRNKKDQDEAFRTGASDLQWPNSKHNPMPSKAVDLAPAPLDWDDLDAFDVLAKLVLAKAEDLGIALRWGADWDRDGKPREKGEWDSPHFELVG